MATQKIYYSISEVSEMLQLPQSTLRYWEKEFDSLRPTLSSKGTRRYTQKDIEMVQTIYYLTNDLGLTLSGAKKRLQLSADDDMRRMQVVNKLKNIKEELLAIRLELNDREALAEEIIIE